MELREMPDCGKWKVIGISGKVDTMSSTELGKKLNEMVEAGGVNIALDFADSGYINSTGLSVLISAFKKCKAKNGAMAIVNPNKVVAQVMEMSAFDRVFVICKGEELASK